MKFQFIAPSAVKPQGWLEKQLRLQADGLHGNLDRVWRDIRDSQWLGGDSDGWERFPYFLDGFIPLAYLLGDSDMTARAVRYAHCLLECQDGDGCFYPKGAEEKKAGDIWSLFLILKVLTVYADCSGDEAVEGAVYRGLQFLDRYLNTNPPFNWAAARWYECLIPVLWLYRRKEEEWLVRLAVRLKAHGLDYGTAVSLWDKPAEKWSYETHVVNIAMALKSEALYREIVGGERTGLAEKMLAKLFSAHGTAYDHFTGDECLSGTSPSQGSELCGVVEGMYSYEWLTALTGEAKWGDLLESLAYNALPAAISADMWTHQYDQQVNQIACMKFESPVFRTNGSCANMFGLEPNFGCCTANFGQGWPKLALSAFMKTPNGVAVVTPLPAEIVLRDGAGDYKLTCISEYPFRTRFSLIAERETEAQIRVPAWTDPVCSSPVRQKDGWLYVTLKGGVSVTVEFPAKPRLDARPDGRYCLKYGALLFALPVAGSKRMLEYTENGVERKYPYCDYEIVPVGEWRYAFAPGEFALVESEYDAPFDRSRPPLKITASLAPVEWEFEKGHDLVASSAAGRVRRGENVRLDLQPYGATDLRMTEMAYVKN